MSDRIAFISGANRGIGFETSKRLAENGIKVILGSRNIEKGKLAAEKIISSGYDVEVLEYDALDSNAPDKVFEYINDKYGKLDILINNAGVLLTGNLFVTNTSTISEKDLKEAFQVNFFSVVSLTQNYFPLSESHLLEELLMSLQS